MSSSGDDKFELSPAEQAKLKSQQRQGEKRGQSTPGDASDGATQQPCKKPTTPQYVHVLARPVQQVRMGRLEERMRRDKWTTVEKRWAGRSHKVYYMPGVSHQYRSLVEVAREYYPECLVVAEPATAAAADVTEPCDGSDRLYAVGDRVEARYQGKADYYSGIVAAVTATGYAVAYDDEDYESNVPEALIRACVEPAAPPDAHTTSGSLDGGVAAGELDSETSDWTKLFGKVAWVESQGFEHWPSIICDPRCTSGEIYDCAMKNLGKKHVCLFYGMDASERYSYQPLSSIVPWEEGLRRGYDKNASHFKPKRYEKAFPKALAEAIEEHAKPKEQRSGVGGPSCDGDVPKDCGFDTQPAEEAPVHEAPPGDEEEPPPSAVARRTPAAAATYTTPSEDPGPTRMALPPVAGDAAAFHAPQDARLAAPTARDALTTASLPPPASPFTTTGDNTRPPPAPPASPTASIGAWTTGNDGLVGLEPASCFPEEVRAPTPILGPLDDLDDFGLLGTDSRGPGIEKGLISLFEVVEGLHVRLDERDRREAHLLRKYKKALRRSFEMGKFQWQLLVGTLRTEISELRASKAKVEERCASLERVVASCVNDHSPEKATAAFYAACEIGNVETARWLLGKGAEVDRLMEDGTTPLFAASKNGHVEMVRFLLGYGAEKDRMTEDAWTPLIIACHNGHVGVALLLLEKGADVHRADKYGQTPLLVACWKGHADLAQLLLDRGAKVDRARKNGATPLMIACEHGHVDAVRLLLLSGAKATRANNQRETPLEIAKRQGHREVVALFKPEAKKAAAPKKARRSSSSPPKGSKPVGPVGASAPATAPRSGANNPFPPSLTPRQQAAAENEVTRRARWAAERERSEAGTGPDNRMVTVPVSELPTVPPPDAAAVLRRREATLIAYKAGRSNACEVRLVGEEWRRFERQADACRAFPDLSEGDLSRLINNSPDCSPALRLRFEARRVGAAEIERSEAGTGPIYRRKPVMLATCEELIESLRYEEPPEPEEPLLELPPAKKRRFAGRWAEDEEASLKELVKELGDNQWDQVAERLGTGRSARGAEQHWEVMRGTHAVARKRKGPPPKAPPKRSPKVPPTVPPPELLQNEATVPPPELPQKKATNFPLPPLGYSPFGASAGLAGAPRPEITERVLVVAKTNAASPGIAALHYGRRGVVTKHTPGWNYVQLDATRDKPSETIPCRNGDLVPER